MLSKCDLSVPFIKFVATKVSKVMGIKKNMNNGIVKMVREACKDKSRYIPNNIKLER